MPIAVDGSAVVVVGADPAAGAEVSQTVPAGKWWFLRSMVVTFVASAVVASRSPQLILDDGANVFARLRGVTAAITANQTGTMCWAADIGAQYGVVGTADVFNNPLPKMLLGPGYRIRTTTAALDPGDNYGPPVLYVVEFGAEPPAAFYLP